MVVDALREHEECDRKELVECKQEIEGRHWANLVLLGENAYLERKLKEEKAKRSEDNSAKKKLKQIRELMG